MLLTGADAIREALGFDDMVDVTLAIEAALHAAETQIASALDTTFERGTTTDEFFVAEPGWTNRIHYETQFRLRKGLILAGSITSKYAVKLEDVPSGLVPTFSSPDLERGIVKDVGTRFDHHYIAITYTYGFEAQAGADADKYVFEQVPKWLQELAKIRAMIELETHPVMENAGIKQDTKMLTRQYDNTLGRHLRYAPLAILPL